MHLILADERLQNQSSRLWVEAYQNGREQGILIFGGNLQTALSVAQYRRSDAMVVYEGPYTNQGLTDEAYKNDKFFNTVDETAEYIIDRLIELHQITGKEL
jgi:hypothetical protein